MNQTVWKQRILPVASWLKSRFWVLQFCTALAVTLVVEMLSRRSLLAGLTFLVQSPVRFLYNVLLVQATLSVAQLVPKRRFAMALLSAVWLGLGTANFVLLGYRTTPLAAIDFALLSSVWSIMGVYLKVWQCVLIVAAFVVLLAVLAIIFVRSPSVKIHWSSALVATAFQILLALSATFLLQQTTYLDTSFSNLAEAYGIYGFPYCFITSVVDRGIDEPENYSEETINAVVDELGAAEAVLEAEAANAAENADTQAESGDPTGTAEQTLGDDSPEQADSADPESGEASSAQAAVSDNAATEQTPNIIMVQLESFFDVNLVEDLTFSENPVPVFTALKEAYPSGYLTVPSIGAGTANTEFEVLTGMSLDYFGTGEYPYKTILQSNTCETVNYNLKELNYTCHAIHNHTGSFYDRQIIFSHLGFDTFTSLEYMTYVETNELGWAKDFVLTPQIEKALNSTEGRDFIYTISVQAHGKYPTDAPESQRPISVSGLEEEADVYRWEYYLEQIHETDAFIGALINALTEYDEPTVVVLFGDHLPSLDLSEEDLVNGDLFQTEYVIWSNFDLEAEDQDLSAYQLTAHVLDLMDIHSGLLTVLHQTQSDDADYQENLELLEYDMLYGNMEAYDGVNPYSPTDLQMGIDTICITGVRSVGGSLYVSGENFTKYSVIYVDGHACNTVYLDSHTLMAPDVVPDDGAQITVAQVADDAIVLSETAAYTYE